MRCFVKIYFSSFALFVFVAGCTVGPDYSRPGTAAESADGYFQTGRHIQDPNALDGVDSWWQGFADPVTTELVERALENNYDLKAAAARLLQAQALLEQARGQRLPQLWYNFSRSRNKMSFNFGGAGRFSVLNTTFTQDLTVNYVMDLFGKLKRNEQAAWADMLAVAANEQALRNSLIASVIHSRVGIATIQRELDIARANTASREKTLDVVQRRYRLGLVGPVDVRLAKENLEAARATEPLLELALITSHNALDVMVGRRPGSSKQIEQTLSDLPDLAAVPVGVPASLLDRRPDVISAEMSLKAANERIGVSIAQLYPDLTLTGSIGRSADRWSDIWLHETEIYSAVFKLAQPIFTGGQLEAQVDAAKARYEELVAGYAKTVLTAMREVEDAMARERLLQVRMKHTQNRFEQAQAAEVLSQQRYQRGVESILAVLESERRRRIAENELAILKGRIWNARVELYLALGGNWTEQQYDEG